MLPTLPDASVDLVLTSPPYNIGKSYESRLTVDDYVTWCAAWLAELVRLLADDGALWLNLGYLDHGPEGRCVPIAYLLWPHLRPLHLVQQVVWAQPNGPAARRRLSPRHEMLLWLVKDPERYAFNLDAVRDPNVKYPNSTSRGRLRANPGGKNPTDVWQLRRVTGGRRSPERTAHPAQMPLELAERIVMASSRPGDLVLDPFSGSGTTLLAAARNGRESRGIELHREYAAIAERRLQETASVVIDEAPSRKADAHPSSSPAASGSRAARR